MPSKSAAGPRAPWGRTLATVAALLFLYIPFGIIVLYAFTTEETAFTFPPPGLTLKWFGEAWNRADLWRGVPPSPRGGGGLTARAPARPRAPAARDQLGR